MRTPLSGRRAWGVSLKIGASSPFAGPLSPLDHVWRPFISLFLRIFHPQSLIVTLTILAFIFHNYNHDLNLSPFHPKPLSNTLLSSTSACRYSNFALFLSPFSSSASAFTFRPFRCPLPFHLLFSLVILSSIAFSSHFLRPLPLSPFYSPPLPITFTPCLLFTFSLCPFLSPFSSLSTP